MGDPVAAVLVIGDHSATADPGGHHIYRHTHTSDNQEKVFISPESIQGDPSCRFMSFADVYAYAWSEFLQKTSFRTAWARCS